MGVGLAVEAEGRDEMIEEEEEEDCRSEAHEVAAGAIPEEAAALEALLRTRGDRLHRQIEGTVQRPTMAGESGIEEEGAPLLK